jgi:citrate synthase
MYAGDTSFTATYLRKYWKSMVDELRRYAKRPILISSNGLLPYVDFNSVGMYPWNPDEQTPDYRGADYVPVVDGHLNGAKSLQANFRYLRNTSREIAGNVPVAVFIDWPNDMMTNLPEAAALINSALILCADHELNVSAFTARCVASAGTTPYGAVIAGLAALQGNKHGGHTERVEALFREVGEGNRVRMTIASRLRRGERIPGFGHPLYPDGDPRAKMLLARTTAVFPHKTTLAQAIVSEVQQTIGQNPTIDFALVTLARALNLPAGAPIALFALGRTVGWIGHAIEQYNLDQLIRPRARYTGTMPEQ